MLDTLLIPSRRILAPRPRLRCPRCRKPIRSRIPLRMMSASAGDTMLDASGNRILDASGNLLLSDGVGDDCCCTPTPPPTCGSCSGNIPTSWTVTLAGITLCTGLTGDPNGTYDVPFSVACQWVYSIASGGPVTVTSGGYDAFSVLVGVFSPFIQVHVTVPTVGGASRTIFNQIHLTSDCCAGFTYTNSGTLGTCGTTFSGSETWGAYGGTAAITPNGC